MDYAYGNEDFGSAAEQMCPNCGSPVNAGDAYCIMCGAELGGIPPRDSSVPKPVGFCEQCGSQLFEGDKFCTACATPVLVNVPGSDPATGTRMVEPDLGASSGDIHDNIGNGQVGGYIPQTPMGTGTVMADSGDHGNDGMGLGGYSLYQANHKPILAEPVTNNDHPTARPKSVRITREEAKAGCRKTIVVDGQSIEVEIPGGVGVYTKLDVPGLGYFDQMTGERGPLRLSFHIV